MAKLSRRDTIKYTILAGLSTGLISGCKTDGSGTDEVHHHHEESIDGLFGLTPEDYALLEQKFFTEHERETVRVLANIIIPADEKSGNAEEAGTVAFIEFMMLDEESFQTPMRGGLRWLDNECFKRYEQAFINCTEDQQRSLLDQIAYPEVAPPELSQGVRFFNMFRNMVATGFWTSKMGIEDLQFMGNKPTAWDGAPQAWLDRLGVSYDS